jgi:hypothetical protein
MLIAAVEFAVVVFLLVIGTLIIWYWIQSARMDMPLLDIKPKRGDTRFRLGCDGELVAPFETTMETIGQPITVDELERAYHLKLEAIERAAAQERCKAEQEYEDALNSLLDYAGRPWIIAEPVNKTADEWRNR